MCGIIGYVGPRRAKPLLIHGLERLEYRGYDSAGLALLEDEGLDYIRAVGNLAEPEEGREAQRLAVFDRARPHALGHPRRVSEENAHPLTGCEERKAAVVLNGIVENFRELKRSLESDGHKFNSETDAEVVLSPRRAALRGRPRRSRPRRVPGARRALRVRRRAQRPPGAARRRPRAVPAARWSRRGRDVPGLGRHGVPARDAEDAADRGRRSRVDHARRRHVHERRGRRGRARA